jgi:hypothetical protein
MCRAPINLSDSYIFYESQHPAFQVQTHVRSRVPLLKTVPLDAVLPELRIAQFQLLLVQV